MPKNDNEAPKDEKLLKSIDDIIESVFEEDGETVKKSEEDAYQPSKSAKTTADAVANAAPKGQDDAARGAGRPQQISDVPKTDGDGSRSGSYDDDVTERDGKEEESEESKKQASKKRSDQTMGKQVKDENVSIKKAISEEEYEEYLALKKAKEEAEKEELKKAEEAKQQERDEKLIKSAVERVGEHFKKNMDELKGENEELRKSLKDSNTLLEKIANRPERRKSIDNVTAIEKSMSPESEDSGNEFTKDEMLDAAEELVMKKSMDFKDEHLIELEQTGFIYDTQARGVLEKHLRSK